MNNFTVSRLFSYWLTIYLIGKTKFNSRQSVSNDGEV